MPENSWYFLSREVFVKTLFVRIGLFMVFVVGLLSIQANTNIIAAKAPAHSPPPPLLMWYRPQFVNINGINGSRSVVFDPATPGLVLASQGSSGGSLLRSNDSGQTWNALPFVPSDIRSSYALAYSSTASFFAYGQAGLYKTTDSGDSWMPLSSPALCNGIITLMVHPTEANTIYGSDTRGFFRSLNGGQAWETFGEIGCDSPAATSFGVGIDESNVVYAGQSYSSDGGGVVRSSNRGETWTSVSTGLPFSGGIPQNHVTVNQLAVDPRDADTVFARTEEGIVYKTVDGGAGWTPLIDGLNNLPVGSFYYDTIHNYRLYATTDYALYYLDDGGTAWVQYPTLPLQQLFSTPLPWKIAVDPFDDDTFVLYNSLAGMIRSSVVVSQVYLPFVSQ